MPSALQFRNWMAGGYALAALALLILAPVPRLQPPRLPEEHLIQVTLEALPEPPPEPTAPAPPQVAPSQVARPPAAVAPPRPAVAPVKPQKPLPRAPVLAPYAAHQVEAAPSAVPAQDVSAPAAPPINPAAASAAAPAATLGRPAETAEELYVARLHSYLESIKRYPTSREARTERPTGNVDLWFVLDRKGGLVEAGIERGSGSMILDQAALSTIRRGEYVPFPTEAWQGHPTRRFTVRLHFSLETNG